ncbi:MAG: response regulator [Gammaproteobacteria bacterium]|jgi:PAS domain S-box-containing protein|nr:response regulator [Gammaproteobacteria bacterium]MBT4377321.1 response regulator [Gammaproteobacteria bacterium]MBT5444581.1 response regulator [Gammaproteobacteria bacterium]MBT6570917.1 response regulator [Gammaproteobacteria bacterium]MBT6665662.1 response regulator [Gammaproteobacteria bacterium]
MIDLSTDKVLDELFTMNFSIAADLGLYNITPRLQRYLGDVEDGQKLFDVFRFHRPGEVSSLKDLASIGASLVLLLSNSGEHGLRGQLLPLSVDGGYRFVGVPWLAWINANGFDSNLDLGDFPKIDSQMDQQIYMSTQKNMVDDLEEINGELRSAEEERDNFLLAAKAPIFAVDANNVIRIWNSELEVALGVSAKSAIGSKIETVFQGETHDSHNLDIGRLLTDGVTEVEVIHSNGSDRTDMLFRLFAHSSKDSAESQVWGLGQDITEVNRQKRERYRLQRLESLGKLTSIVAHDFNNLLAIISGNLRFITIDEDDKEVLEDIDSAVNDAIALIKKLRSFSDESKNTAETFNVKKGLEQFVRLVQPVVGKDLDIVISEVDPGISINADKADFDNSLLNLVINAKDASDVGSSVFIDVEVISNPNVAVLKDQRYVKIRVRDLGCGMDDLVIERAFEPFFSTKGRSRGEGLGLNSVFSFAHANSGHCTIESAVGIGTTVSVYLPLGATKVVPLDLPDVAHEGGAGSGLILVVDDEARVRKITCRDLKAMNFDVIEAEDADDALKKLQNYHSQLVLVVSDIVMPGSMSGIELKKVVEEKYDSLSVLLVSGNSLQEWESVDQVLRKPYSLVEFQALVNAYARRVDKAS